MKKITLFAFAFLAFTLIVVSQHSFPTIAGPTNVAQGTPVTLNINDAGNTAAAPASSTGSYSSFSVTVDWTAGGGGPYSSEAQLTVNTTGSSIFFGTATTGGDFNGLPTTLTFDGDFTAPYDPISDGTLDLILDQTWGGSDADWSNIVVTIFETPLCPEPTGLTIGGISATTAEISWTAGGSETDWEIFVQPAGTGVPTGSGTSVTNNPYTATGLTALTDYEVYIRSNCVADGLSSWAGPVNFTSACDVFVPDYLEDFTTIIPNCWDEADNGDATTGPTDLGAGSWLADGFLNNGFSGAYKINLWQAFKSDWIISPQFDLTGGPFQVDFDFGIMQYASSTNAGTLGSDDTVQLFISTDNGSTWTNLITFDNTTVVPATGTQVVYDLTAYSGQTVQFAILGSEGTVDDTEDNDIFVDNFRVRTIPSCPEPTGLTVGGISATTAEISWDLGGSETDWEIAVQPAGTGVPTGSGTAVTTNPYTATGLTAVTDYEVYIRANCIAQGLSSWVGPVNFITACDVFIPDYLEDFTTIIPNCWDEADNGDATTGPTDLGAGSWTADGYLNNGFSGAYKINLYAAFKSDWILSPQFDLTGGPFQVDFDFAIMQWNSTTNVGTLGSDDTVQLFISTDNGSTWTNLLTFDNTTVVPSTGTQIVYDLTAYSGQIVQFAILGSEGTVNDAEDNDIFIDNFRVRAIPSCPEPLGLTATILSSTEVDVSWTDNGQTLWEYVLQPAGTGEPASGTDVSTTTVNETGLSPETDYEVYIRTDCGGDVYSEWYSVTFTTPPANDFCSDAIMVSCGDSVSGSTVMATDGDEPAEFCGTGGGAPGLWYEFTGTGDVVTMSLCNSTFDTKIQVWEGDCSSLTCINGNDDSCGLQSEVVFLSTAGTSYYIYVFGFGSSTGDYTLDVTCVTPPDPPANDECETPTTIIANADDTCTEFTSGTVYGATASSQSNGCNGTADDDVWFEFEAVATDHAVTLNNATGDLSFGVYEGDDCNNLTELYCSPFFGDPTIIANGLTVGNTYLVRVYSTTANPLQDITFDICVFTIPPPIYTSETDYTVEEIIRDVLTNENPDCPQISNITYSTGTDFGSTNGIGYFEDNGSDWPFGAGLIMTTGNILNAPGPEDEILSEGGFAWPGDADLENAIPGLNLGDTNNASIIEFDFVPIIEHMSFDFIFAAEEYGTFQCTFTDAFAFLLTDSNGVTTNLAIVPGTVDPISVINVRDNTYNANCDSQNPEYFDTFYGTNGEDEITAPIDFKGHTVVMTAEADVIPNEQYHIKLVIADDGDTLYDSAVFIGAGTFDIGYPDLGEDILLGSGQETCEGVPLTLDAGEIPPNAEVTWFMDGEVIEGETSQTIQVTETAFYGAEFSFPFSDCGLYDEVLIEFFENPEPVAVQETVIRCVGLEVTLEVTVENSDVPDTLTYYWTYEGNQIQDGPDNTYTIAADSDELGEYIVTVIDERGCYGETTITVVEGVYPVVEAVEPLIDKCINEDVTLEATVVNPESLSDNLTYTWYIGSMEMQSSSDNTYVHAAGEAEAEVTVVVTDELSQCSGETDISVVYYINDNCVDLPQGLSPNGDGDNDCLILDHLEDKEDITSIEVFNRHGIKIYELNQYVDQWCGTDQDGKLMPVGTYFYVIHTKAREPRTSWIYLNY